MICDPSGELSANIKRLIDHEWERLRIRKVASSNHVRLMALATSFTRSPESLEEAKELLVYLVEAITEREIEYSEVIRQMVLDHHSPSQFLLLGLFDTLAENLEPYEKEVSFDRIIAVQSSALTHISFDAMKPC